MTPLLGPRHVAARESAVVPAHSKTAKLTNPIRFDSIRSMKPGCAGMRLLFLLNEIARPAAFRYRAVRV